MIFHDEQIYTQLLSAVSRQGLLQKSRKELILIDTDKQAFTFTLWEETIIEDEGKKLLDQFQKRLIIFARRIGVSKYNGISLTTKFNTTIQIDPPYSQCLQLHTWVTENREMLTSFSLRSTSESGSLISISVDEQIVPIANVQSQQDGHSFSIETKVSLPNKLKSCYVLLCPNCKQEVRSLIKRKFLCMTCKQQNMLIPRCKFDVNLQDASGSIIGIIMDKEAEKLLSLTTDEIYALASNEDNLFLQSLLRFAEQREINSLLKLAFDLLSCNYMFQQHIHPSNKERSFKQLCCLRSKRGDVPYFFRDLVCQFVLYEILTAACNMDGEKQKVI
ncbi:replication protein A 70 kDa DNA-binding subunit B-like isoform X3 [Lycium barbarum]|uniref:replication protein A 70 kDa DNA-binding subunit B-like isoform X3 n=1 Tax=Lycium barbarum TaxID=112863 RepID=UPI00293E03E4|nr:replication protein A 70 kDa DNA-binding subunit B-like isoform X3 [Lycium barbarum]